MYKDFGEMLFCKIKHAKLNAFAVLMAREFCMKSTKRPKVTYSELRTMVLQKQLFYCPKQVKSDQPWQWHYEEKAMNMQQDNS